MVKKKKRKRRRGGGYCMEDDDLEALQEMWLDDWEASQMPYDDYDPEPDLGLRGDDD